MVSQLATLGVPFPSQYVHENPNGYGSYVAHHLITQKLLMVLGPYDFELVQVIRGGAPGGKDDTARLEDVIVGAVCRLSVSIDGIPTRIEEVGDCERPSNWPHDGARLKDAMSDAIKRCAMRLGVGLHLWAGNEFVLDAKKLDAVITRRTGSTSPMDVGETEPAQLTGLAVEPGEPAAETTPTPAAGKPGKDAA